MSEQKQSGEQQTEPLYFPADFYMVRASALPALTFLQLSSAGHVDMQPALDEALSRGEQVCTDVLLKLAARPQVRQALALASPSLAESLERFLRGEAQAGQRKRLSAGLLRYLIRMSTRPTPFGLFAGVAVGSFAEHTDLRLGETAIARFRTRPDMHWLLSLLRKIEEDPTLVAQLNVRLNQTAYLVGERAVLPFADIYGEQDNRAITLRATSVVRKVFELASGFIPYADLQVALQHAFPQATREQIERVLNQLWEHHFFISSLHPPLTTAQPTEYVHTQLDTLHGCDEIKAHIERVLEDAHDLDCAGIGAPLTLLSTLVQEQGKLVPTESLEYLPVQVDSALQIRTSALHQSLGQAAARAAEFLLRQTPLPRGLPHLQEYRELFLETYGEQAEVPLLDLLSPENGLDTPAGYQQPPRTNEQPAHFQDPVTSHRDQVLLRLLTETLNAQRREVELTREIQQQLERWSPTLEEAPLSLELYLQIHAASREAIDAGQWSAVIGSNCGSPSAGRTFGRFYDLLGEDGMHALRRLVACEEAILPDIIFAELSYQPWQGRMANVALRPPLRSYEIAVGTTPSVSPECVLTLSDLVVGVRHGRFYVRSLRLGKQVRVGQSHMLNTLLAPNVCRFLTEIANDGQPALSPFDWGALATAPFLPRLNMKVGPSATVVIAPARWQLQAETIHSSGEGAEETRWFRGLQIFREQWHVPRYVYLTDMDNRLLLDLENPLMAAQLRDALKKLKNQTQLTLEELLPDFEHLWLRDEQGASYFAEIVVPLLRADAFDPASRADMREKKDFTPHRVITSYERKRFPGEEWAYLKLYAAVGQHEELLAGPVRELISVLQEHELLDRWFFIRYSDPEPHLRLRFHAKDDLDSSAILALALPWSVQLARRGRLQRVVLDTYKREVERYGGPEAIDLLEHVFTADSVMVSDLIAFQYGRHLTLDPLAVAVFTLDYLFAAWGCDLQQRQSWTQQASEKYAWSKEYRAERKRFCDLLSPGGQLDSSLTEQRALLLELLRPRESFLGEIGRQVRQLATEDRLWVSETSLLGSLAHMHVNRLLGLDHDRERQVYAFWRHTLDSLVRRPDLSHFHHI